MKRTASLGVLLAALCGCAGQRDCCHCCCQNACCPVVHMPAGPCSPPSAAPKAMPNATVPQTLPGTALPGAENAMYIPEGSRSASAAASKDGLEEIEALRRANRLAAASPGRLVPQPMSETRPVSQSSPAPEANRPTAGPMTRQVNSKRILLHYELRDAQALGIVGVELWYTQDTKSWYRHEAPPHKNPPYVIEVSEEGTYGFTLIPCNSAGRIEKPPQPGDQPQIWISVELTKPYVRLVDIKPAGQGPQRAITVMWEARDRNLTSKPITLSYAEQIQGPWVPVAANLENSGRYTWQVPASMPDRFYVRVEAMDQYGNVGLDQTPHPILLSFPQPRATITSVDQPSQRPTMLPNVAQRFHFNR